MTRASSACQQKALAHYNTLVFALMAATALDRGTPQFLPKVAQCFVSILAQAEMLGQLEGMRGAIANSFDQPGSQLNAMDARVRTSFVYVVMTLREDLMKV